MTIRLMTVAALCLTLAGAAQASGSTILGGAIGGAAGAAVGYDNRDDGRRYERRVDERRYEYRRGDYGRGDFCPPGQAKKGRC